MCISDRIQKIQAEKKVLDAKIAKLEEMESKTEPVKAALYQLFEDYRAHAPEELKGILREIEMTCSGYYLAFMPEEELFQGLLEISKLHVPEVAEMDLSVSGFVSAHEYEVATGQSGGKPLTNTKGSSEPEANFSKEKAAAMAKMLQSSEVVSRRAGEAFSEQPSSEGPITIESILTSKGFFQPEDLTHFESDSKYENYRGWDVYFSLSNGGIIAIGLYNEQYNQPWDCCAEYLQEADPAFPESLADYYEIVMWTRNLIDQVENLEVPGQLSLEFSDPAAAPEQTKLQKLLEGNSNFTFEELGISVNFQSIFTEEEIESEDEDESDDPVTKKVEEALITTCNTEGRHWEYYVNAQTFIYQYTIDSLEQAALGYAQHFLRDLEKEAKIKDKITQWNTGDAQQSESAKPDTETEFEMMGLKIRVHPQLPMGVTFRFLNPDNTLAFSNSLISAEISDRTWKACAFDLIQNYRDKEATRLEKETNPYKKPEDNFVELVKLTPAVGYLKRKDNGELLSAYAAFANSDTDGKKTATMAKSRAKQWTKYLHSTFESCGWIVDEPRKISRMVAKPEAKQQFAYEIKITGKFSIGQLQKLAEEDLSLLPNEELPARPKVINSFSPPTSTQAYKVKVNSYELASGTKEEMRSRFEEELKILGGSQMSVLLLAGSEIVESYRVNDFQFTQVEDFDTENPEYEVTHLPSQKPFKVYKRLAIPGYPPNLSGWTNTVYPYTPGFTKREAAAADAMQRLLKAQNSAE